jgi:hypothetical protein
MLIIGETLELIIGDNIVHYKRVFRVNSKDRLY